MKKIFILVCASLIALGAQAWSLRDILGVGSNTDSTSTTSSGGSALGGAIGSIVGGLLGTSDFDIDDLVGTWTYTSPAITLASDNALQKIGGSVATASLEKKLEPYYKTLGVNKIEITVDEEHNFTMKMSKGSASGTIEKDEDGQLVFNFKAFNKINLGKVKTMAQKTGNNLTLTFDVSRLKSVVEKAASLSSNTTIKGLAALLDSYDGLYAGFKLKRK